MDTLQVHSQLHDSKSLLEVQVNIQVHPCFHPFHCYPSMICWCAFSSTKIYQKLADLGRLLPKSASNFTDNRERECCSFLTTYLVVQFFIGFLTSVQIRRHIKAMLWFELNFIASSNVETHCAFQKARAFSKFRLLPV